MYPYDYYPENRLYTQNGSSFFYALRSHILFSLFFNIVMVLLLLLLYNLQPYFIVEVKRTSQSENTQRTRSPHIVPQPQPAPNSSPETQEYTKNESPYPFPNIVYRYKVRPGDTLEKISEKFRVQADAVLWYNEINNPNMIYAGQEILIPKKE